MSLKKKIMLGVLAILTSLSLVIDLKVVYQKPVTGLSILKVGFLVMLLLAVACFLFYRKYQGHLHPLKLFLAILFALFMVLGNSYQQIGSWNLVFGSPLLLALSLLQVICYTFLFRTAFLFLDDFLKKSTLKECSIKNVHVKKIITKFQEHPFLFSLIVMLLFWLIYMIAFYPLILSKDPSFQIKQFFNVPTKYIDYVIPLSPDVNLTNHHPVLHTLLLGGFINVGRFLGSDNLGLFLYAIFQTIILASSLALTIFYLYKRKKSLKLCFFLLAIYALVPMFPFYAMSAVKDTLYTAMIIFYVVFFFHILDKKKETKLGTPAYIILFFLSLLIALLRNNGLYIVLLSHLFLLFYRRKEAVFLGIVLLLFIGSYYTYDKVLLPHFKIPAGSIREALSIPFQQTARYVKEHGEEVTKEERKAIDTVLEYDTIASRYNPVLADAVKNKYNKYTTKKELNAYFKVWFQEFQKHPTTYIEATLHNTYGYFYPETANWYLYCGRSYNKLITEDNLVDYHYNSLGLLRDILSGYGLAFPYIPVLGMISNIGFAGWMLLLCSVYLLLSNKKKYVIALIPLLGSLAVCFLSPANTYFRYSMPYVFLMPFVACMTYRLLIKTNKEA